MSLSPPSPDPVMQGLAPASAAGSCALDETWSALHAAAGVVAALAGLSADPFERQQRAYPAAIRQIGGWRFELARQGIDDLAAIMESGLGALLALHRQGSASRIPARALWDEFEASRAGLFALLSPCDAAHQD